MASKVVPTSPTSSTKTQRAMETRTKSSVVRSGSSNKLQDTGHPPESTQRAMETRTKSSVVRSGSSNKQPLHRLRPAVDRYLKILDIHLNRLQQHHCNMEKIAKTENWSQLHAEQVNASSTVRQMTAMLGELQRIRLQVLDNQLTDFYAAMQEFGNKAATSLHSVLSFCQDRQSSEENSNVPQPLPISALQQTVTSACVMPDNTEAAASREQLTQDMEQLQAWVLYFLYSASITTEAGESTVTGNVVVTPTDSVDSGAPGKGNKLKLAVLPVVGALLGGVVAGPVGLFTGIKIGIMAGSVGGGVAGLAGTTILNSQEKASAKKAPPDPSSKDDNAATDPRPPTSHPSTPSSTPPTPITKQSPAGMSSSVSSSSLSSCQVSPAQSPDDNRRDSNGNVSFWDRILS